MIDFKNRLIDFKIPLDAQINKFSSHSNHEIIYDISLLEEAFEEVLYFTITIKKHINVLQNNKAGTLNN